MIAIASTIALVVLSVSVLLNLYRLAIGPDVLDRVLALDTMVIIRRSPGGGARSAP